MNYNFNGDILKNGQPAGGGKVYLHRISVHLPSGGDVYCEIYSSSLTPYTAETLKTFIGNSKCLGAHNCWNDQNIIVFAHDFYVSSNKLYVKTIRYNPNLETNQVYVFIPSEITTITDTVVEL